MFEDVESHMKKFRAWHGSLIAVLITITSIFLFGPKKLILGIIILYMVLLPTSYLLERKNKLSLWQKRIIIALMDYPILSLFILANDIIYSFIAPPAPGKNSMCFL